MGIRQKPMKSLDEQLDRRINEFAVKPSPVSLSPVELDLGHNRISHGAAPIPVEAWVRYPETVIRARGVALEWTAKAVHIEWQAADGSTRRAWVWASAVTRIEQPHLP